MKAGSALCPVQNSLFPVLELQQRVLRASHSLTLHSSHLVLPLVCRGEAIRLPNSWCHPISPTPAPPGQSDPVSLPGATPCSTPCAPLPECQLVHLHPGTAPARFPWSPQGPAPPPAADGQCALCRALVPACACRVGGTENTQAEGEAGIWEARSSTGRPLWPWEDGPSCPPGAPAVTHIVVWVGGVQPHLLPPLWAYGCQ